MSNSSCICVSDIDLRKIHCKIFSLSGTDNACAICKICWWSASLAIDSVTGMFVFKISLMGSSFCRFGGLCCNVTTVVLPSKGQRDGCCGLVCCNVTTVVLLKLTFVITKEYNIFSHYASIFDNCNRKPHFESRKSGNKNQKMELSVTNKTKYWSLFAY